MSSGPIRSSEMSDLTSIMNPQPSTAAVMDSLMSEGSSGVYANGFDSRENIIDHPPRRLAPTPPPTRVTADVPAAAAAAATAPPLADSVLLEPSDPLSEPVRGLAALALPEENLASIHVGVPSIPALPPTTSRVRHASTLAANTAIDTRTAVEVQELENDRARITAKIAQLQYEWDVDRVVELQSSVSVILLTVLGIAQGPLETGRWLYLTLLVSVMLLMHALHGWSPVLDVLRWFGVRTAAEIHEEVVALKAMRGDFGNINTLSTPNVMRHSRIVPPAQAKLPIPEEKGREPEIVQVPQRGSYAERVRPPLVERRGHAKGF